MVYKALKANYALMIHEPSEATARFDTKAKLLSKPGLLYDQADLKYLQKQKPAPIQNFHHLSGSWKNQPGFYCRLRNWRWVYVFELQAAQSSRVPMLQRLATGSKLSHHYFPGLYQTNTSISNGQPRLDQSGSTYKKNSITGEAHTPDWRGLSRWGGDRKNTLTRGIQRNIELIEHKIW